MISLDEKWDSIKNRVIIPLWHGKFKKMYEQAKMDYDDFESLAGLELTKAISTFDAEKSNLFTFATRVITKKALTELRDCQRDKRKTLHVSESIDKCTYDDSSRTMIEDIPFESDEQETSELSELRVGNFVNSLDNNQLRVLILTLLDFNNEDIPEMLKISKSTAQTILRSLKDTDLTRVLYRRKF